MSELTDFYCGSGRDSEGRYIDELWARSDDDLLHAHDVIQWLFPTERESDFNPDAPVLTKEDVRLFHANPQLRENLLTSFHRFLTVWDLRAEDGKIVGDTDNHIFQSLNHNWLRFSRVLRSLTTLGLVAEAQAFYEFLVEHVPEPGDSLKYWSEAVSKP